jgi:hypothetical protein
MALAAPPGMGRRIGSIFSLGVYAMMAWLMIYPLSTKAAN